MLWFAFFQAVHIISVKFETREVGKLGRIRKASDGKVVWQRLEAVEIERDVHIHARRGLELEGSPEFP